MKEYIAYFPNGNYSNILKKIKKIYYRKSPSNFQLKKERTGQKNQINS